MKKIKVFGSALLLSVCLSSCYNTRVLVGNVKANDPVVKVNSQWNHNIIFGLVPVGNNKMEAKEYVSGRENYVVRVNKSFLNGFVEILTCGIYNPMTTTYYIPLDENQAKNE